MRLNREVIVATLRENGDHDRAQKAVCELPRTVDTELDAGVLHEVGLNVADVENAD